MRNLKNRSAGKKRIGFRRYINEDDNKTKAEIKKDLEIKPIKTNKNGSQNIKKKRGRPRTKVSTNKNTRSRNISICLSLNEEIAWKKIAKLNGKSLSSFVRDVVNKECI